MTEQPRSAPTARQQIFNLLWRDTGLRILAGIFVIAELYNTAILPAYINTKKVVETRPIAQNAKQKQLAEAEAQSAEAAIKEQQALVQTEIARQSARRQKAEANLAQLEAEAAKLNAAVLEDNNAPQECTTCKLFGRQLRCGVPC